MKSAFNKEIVRSITGSAGRFVAIAIISLLGAGFYAGLRMAAPDMRIAGDEFFDATNTYDISVISTLGLDDESIEVLKGIEGVGEVMASYRADAMVNVGDGSYAASIESLPAAAQLSDTSDGVHAYSNDAAYLNRPILTDGDWPASVEECVVSEEAAESLGISIGDSIVVEKTIDDVQDSFACTAFTVAGLVNSPLFISASQQGTTSLGTGSIELYLYVPADAFNPDLPYTVAYLDVPQAEGETWDTSSYETAVAQVKLHVEERAPEIAALRRAAVVGDAQDELDGARRDYEAKRADAQAQLDDAASELEGARSQLDSAAAQLIAGRSQVDDAAAQLEASEKQLADAEAAYEEGAAQLAEQRAAFEEQASQLDELKGQRVLVEEGIERANSGIEVLEARLAEAQAAGDEALIAGIQEQLAAVRAQLAELNGQLAQIDGGIAAIEQGARQLEAAQAELDAARAQLDEGWAQLANGRVSYLDGLREYESGLVEYRDGERSYAEGLADYDKGKADAEAGFADAEKELADAQREIDDIEHPSVYVIDRAKNPGAASLSSDADGIVQIATFLPFMFFLVAALVSLTSMTRMVDEERLEIGTHKALGYGKARITSKYLVYGALASGIGSIAGVVLLGKLLPWFILTSYAVSYNVPVFPTPLDPVVTAKALGLSVGITLIATWAAAAASLRERPAALMLPRVPKAGKRIVLERIGPLWRRFSFSQKVTARNLLRYKRRFFMAVVGIAGCTALLMVGFGLRDAIGGIVANQYEELMRFDAAVRVDDEEISASEGKALQAVLDSDDVANSLPVADYNVIAQGPDGDMRIELVVPANPEEISGYVALRDRASGQALELEEGTVVLTEKAASQLGASVGDSVKFYGENEVGEREGEGFTFTLGGIAENYLGHYCYLSPATYEEVYGAEPTYDLHYVDLADNADGARLSDELLAIDGVTTVSFVADQIATYEEMLAVMDKLIVVIVLLSAALAFVVLYNLTNINIAERVREIATLKVLGFTRGEVNTYIFREVVIMSLIGALLGCVAGVPLTFYIAEAAETVNMMFGRTIEPASFVVSFIITMLFTLIVAFAMRHKLARVNMVESLKSIE